MATITNTAPAKGIIKRIDHYQKVTSKIISLLEQGIAPWRKPWGSFGLARNAVTNHTYSGINALLLNMVAPYKVPLYITHKQIRTKGGYIKRGTKAEWVYFYSQYYKDAAGKKVAQSDALRRHQNGEVLEEIRFLKSFPIYNISCIEGVDIEIPTMPVRDNRPLESCETFLACLSPAPKYFTIDTDRARYNWKTDIITLPDLKYFEASEEYYATLFHEIVHSTGHSSRLGRVGVTDPKSTFGTKLYAEEELVAEIGASFLCAFTGIGRDKVTQNSAAYIQNWLAQLRNDKKFIFRCAARAQEAVDFLYSTK